MFLKSKRWLPYVGFGLSFIILLGFVIGYVYTADQLENKEISNNIEGYETKLEDIINENTDSTEQAITQDINLIQTVTTKIYYTVCGHVITNEIKMPDDIKGLNRSQIELAYSDWKIEEFERDKIVLSKIVNKKCPNHYVIKERDGKVAVFYQQEIDGILLHEITNISINGLSAIDQEKLIKGIAVDSNEKLAEILEDLDS